MKIIYTLPGITVPHGGYRIVMEHLTRLQKLGHDVALFVENGKPLCDWYEHTFPIWSQRACLGSYDVIVIGSPHSIWVEERFPGKKIFLFMQMVEEKFRPNDHLWHRQCKQFYLSKHPIIHGSHWGEQHCRSLGRTGQMHYIRNGVNFEHFPIEQQKKNGDIVLLEGPFNKNPAKDVLQLALTVARRLRDENYTIMGYGFDDCPSNSPIHFYIKRPTISQMNDMYRVSGILLKATKYDARALSPVEAMTKGCVPIRAIIDGDDDLSHGKNSFRVPYDFRELKLAALNMMGNQPILANYSECCLSYVQEFCNWDTIIPELEKILLS